MNWSAKRSKYHNETVTVDGIRYDSKNEMLRHNFLKMMEQAGEISNLRYHVKYELIPAITEDVVVHLKTKDKIVTKTVQTAIFYECDFVYTISSNGEEVYEDFKGVETDVFKLKKKLFFWRYGKHIYTSRATNDMITTKK